MSRYAFHRISYSTLPSDKLITHILIFILTFLNILLYRLLISNPITQLLLLGAGASGKSTVLKQMRLIHNVSFTPAELECESRLPLVGFLFLSA
jgi:hypothetical protein